MTGEEYHNRKAELLAQLKELDQEYLKGSPYNVGDVIVDKDGKRYIIREIKVINNACETCQGVSTVSKQKKDGTWQDNIISVWTIAGELKVEGTDIKVKR